MRGGIFENLLKYLNLDITTIPAEEQIVIRPAVKAEKSEPKEENPVREGAPVHE